MLGPVMLPAVEREHVLGLLSNPNPAVRYGSLLIQGGEFDSRWVDVLTLASNEREQFIRQHGPTATDAFVVQNHRLIGGSVIRAMAELDDEYSYQLKNKVRFIDDQWSTPLHHLFDIIATHDDESLQSCVYSVKDLSQTVDFVYRQDHLLFDETLGTLHMAAISGNVLATEKLVFLGVDVDQLTGNGRTALTFAAYGNYLRICELLVEAGADIDNGLAKGRSAIFWAASQGCDQIVCYLMDREASVQCQPGAGTHILHCSGLLEDDTFWKLVERGADVNAKDRLQSSPLASAVAQRRYNHALRLIRAGADEKSTDKWGKTAYDYLTKNNPDEVKAFLKQVELARPEK